MTSDRERWNRRYGERECAMGEEPSRFLAEQLPAILREVPGRAALDVACGEGRNSVFLARAGFDVVGVDGSDVALGKARAWAERECVTVEFEQADLAVEPLPEGPFDVIVMFNFMLRELIPELYERLSDGGFLVVQALLATKSGSHTRSAEHVLAPGEILRLFDGLAGTVVFWEDDEGAERARIVLRKAGR